MGWLYHAAGGPRGSTSASRQPRAGLCCSSALGLNAAGRSATASDLTALRIGFEQGLYSRDDVRAWVDAEVTARDVLPPQLLDLATMATRTTTKSSRSRLARNRDFTQGHFRRAEAGQSWQAVKDKGRT
jgi:hypothetical protein